jgi:hypothetical protein
MEANLGLGKALHLARDTDRLTFLDLDIFERTSDCRRSWMSLRHRALALKDRKKKVKVIVCNSKCISLISTKTNSNVSFMLTASRNTSSSLVAYEVRLPRGAFDFEGRMRFNCCSSSS